MSYNPLVPRRCYATDEFTGTYTDDNGVVVMEEVTVYSHPTHGVVGCVSVTFHDGNFVSEEWVSYDPALVL